MVTDYTVDVEPYHVPASLVGCYLGPAFKHWDYGRRMYVSLFPKMGYVTVFGKPSTLSYDGQANLLEACFKCCQRREVNGMGRGKEYVDRQFKIDLADATWDRALDPRVVAQMTDPRPAIWIRNFRIHIAPVLPDLNNCHNLTSRSGSSATVRGADASAAFQPPRAAWPPQPKLYVEQERFLRSHGGF